MARDSTEPVDPPPGTSRKVWGETRSDSRRGESGRGKVFSYYTRTSRVTSLVVLQTKEGTRNRAPRGAGPLRGWRRYHPFRPHVRRIPSLLLPLVSSEEERGEIGRPVSTRPGGKDRVPNGWPVGERDPNPPPHTPEDKVEHRVGGRTKAEKKTRTKDGGQKTIRHVPLNGE